MTCRFATYCSVSLVILLHIIASCCNQQYEENTYFLSNVCLSDSLLASGDTIGARQALERAAEVDVRPNEKAEIWLRCAEMGMPVREDELMASLEFYDGMLGGAAHDRKMKMRSLLFNSDRMTSCGKTCEAISLKARAAAIAYELDMPQKYFDIRSQMHRQQLACGHYIDAIVGHSELLDYCTSNKLNAETIEALYDLENTFLAIDDVPKAAAYLDQIEHASDTSAASVSRYLLAFARLSITNTDTVKFRRIMNRLCNYRFCQSLKDDLAYDMECTFARYFIATHQFDSARSVIIRLPINAAEPMFSTDYALIKAQYYLALQQPTKAKIELDKINPILLRRVDVGKYERYTELASRFYAVAGDDQMSYFFLKEKMALIDSLNRDAIGHEVAYQNFALRKDTTIAAQNLLIRKQQSVKQRLIVVQSLIVFSLVMLSLVVILLYLRHSVARAQKREAELEKQKQQLATEIRQRKFALALQKRQLDEKNIALRQELQYANQVQTNSLPPSAILDADPIKDFFILYQPANIVSGDFYWFYDSGDKLFVAVGDATGHGVPGALIALTSVTILNDIVVNKENQSSLAIMNLFNDMLSDILHGNDDIVNKDSVDFSLLTIDRIKGSITLSLARHTAYIVRVSSEVVQLSGVKRSICESDDVVSAHRPYETVSLSLSPDDCLYLFSDGYESQMGGPADRKLRRKTMLDYFVELSQQPMEIQKNELSRRFNTWKGCNEQTDDVLIVGLRFNDNVKS